MTSVTTAQVTTRGGVTAAALCAGLPGVILTLVFGLSGVVTLGGGRPLIWAPADATLSQATALRDQGEVIRLIMLGTDPNRRYRVDGVFRPGEAAMLTPLEAAVITRELHLVELVVDYGGGLGQNNAAVLQCLAVGVRAEAIRDYLVRAAGITSTCEGVVLPWQP